MALDPPSPFLEKGYCGYLGTFWRWRIWTVYLVIGFLAQCFCTGILKVVLGPGLKRLKKVEAIKETMSPKITFGPIAFCSWNMFQRSKILSFHMWFGIRICLFHLDTLIIPIQNLNYPKNVKNTYNSYVHSIHRFEYVFVFTQLTAQSPSLSCHFDSASEFPSICHPLFELPFRHHFSFYLHCAHLLQCPSA